MKKHPFLPILLSLLFSLANQTCQPPKSLAIQRTSFQVCAVQASSQALPTQSYRDVLLQKIVFEQNRKARESAIYQDKALGYPEKRRLLGDTSYHPKDIPVRVLEAASRSEALLIDAGFHPFVAALHTAYANHYPLVISPDMIWLLITQGFATHINQHPEEMRRHFVDFKGKKLLNVDRPSFKKGDESNNWPGVFTEFSKLIEDNTGPTLSGLVTGDFSTTGPAEKIAFQITLMDAMKSYFMYSVTTMCGIPEITLEGSIQDWEKIEDKTRELAQYDLGWWTSELLPILQEFKKAAAGQADREFWQSMYKINEVGSGTSHITGWILKFFPYKDLGGTMVQVISAQKATPSKPGINYELRATTSEFTSGLSQADFIWNYFGRFYKMEFVAGFVGFQQNPNTFALRPEIGWAVIDKQVPATVEEIEDYWKGGNKEYREGRAKQ